MPYICEQEWGVCLKNYENVPSCYDRKSVGSAEMKDLVTRHPTPCFHSKFLNSFQMKADENYSGALIEATIFS
jgi:hypothetical protein